MPALIEFCYLAATHELLGERVPEQRLVHLTAAGAGPVGVVLAGLGPPVPLVEQPRPARLVLGRQLGRAACRLKTGNQTPIRGLEVSNENISTHHVGDSSLSVRT